MLRYYMVWIDDGELEENTKQWCIAPLYAASGEAKDIGKVWEEADYVSLPFNEPQKVMEEIQYLENRESAKDGSEETEPEEECNAELSYDCESIEKRARETKLMERAPLADGSKYEIQRTLALSTVHIREETSVKLFDSNGSLMQWKGELHSTVMLASVYELGEYGWLLHVLDDATTDDLRMEGLSDLADIAELARSLGCDWIRLDRDGPTYDGLPTYDWSEPDK